MKCSHNLPLESKCVKCAEEGMKFVRTYLATPPGPKATKEQRREFWAEAYRRAHPEANYPSTYLG